MTNVANSIAVTFSSGSGRRTLEWMKRVANAVEINPADVSAPHAALFKAGMMELIGKIENVLNKNGEVNGRTNNINTDNGSDDSDNEG